jgi:Flp pilus assembly pilin Flp
METGMLVGLFASESDQAGMDETDSAPEAPKHKRRGTTAMEYLFMTSLVVVVLIIGAQQVGLVTGKLLKNSADATEKTNK